MANKIKKKSCIRMQIFTVGWGMIKAKLLLGVISKDKETESLLDAEDSCKDFA